MGRTPETPRVVVKTVFMPDEMEKDIITKSLEVRSIDNPAPHSVDSEKNMQVVADISFSRNSRL